jgi:glutaconate CoA-transferase subunit B
LIYESGAIGAKPDVLPLSIGDGELADTADTVVSVPEIFRYWLQGGRVDVGFLGAAQMDRFANLNTTVIGDYRKPKVRLPGAGGAPEIATSAKSVCIIVKQNKRSFVERLDFTTSSGSRLSDKNGRHPQRGPTTVITDLAIFVSDAQTGELTLSAVHPGITVEEVREATSWDLRVSNELGRTPEPTQVELATLRDLYQRTAVAHGTAAEGE